MKQLKIIKNNFHDSNESIKIQDSFLPMKIKL